MKDHRSGRRYDAQFKEQAVRLVLSSGKSIGCVARELGVSPHTLKDWKETHLENGGSAVALDLEKPAAASGAGAGHPSSGTS